MESKTSNEKLKNLKLPNETGESKLKNVAWRIEVSSEAALENQ